MSQLIRKAVFPVAGLGTRFLPVTKANPKEMLPIVDKPLIQYAAEEALEAGIKELIFVTGRNKRSIPDHFDKAYELESELEKKGKTETLKIVQNILPDDVTCIYIRQAQALGLGHAVLCARSALCNEPFAVILADDLIDNPAKGSLKQMIEVFNQHQRSVVAVETVPKEETYRYGIVSATDISERLKKMTGIVEKPKPEEAPTNLAVVGRYVFTATILDQLEKTGKGAGGEIQLTDAIA
ncbi:MAG TPA: UTP--glucose-1-phosphate uridylyltransferase GalU, partial [Gammaproteobacteria bacterium]